MRFTPRQIVVRAQETAYLLLATLDREALVSRFLQSYAKDQNRAGVITQPELYGDLMASVRREALLAMVTHVDEALPRRLGKKRAKRRASVALVPSARKARPSGPPR